MAVTTESAQLAVLGSPIAHSKSPALHTAAYHQLGLPWSYTAHQCNAEELEDFLSTRDQSWRGFSVTMPLKERAYQLATVVDPIAAETGVVNTLLRIIDGPNGPQWAGFNTDVSGLAAALQRTALDPTRTVVLGAGATATSAVLAARSLGASSITVIARRQQAAENLADRFQGTQGAQYNIKDVPAVVNGIDVEAARSMEFNATLVISTLPSTAGTDFDVPESLLNTPLFDVAYDPWPSPLAQRWTVQNTPVFSGVEMLFEQAILQIRIFTTGDPSTPIDEEKAMREHMRSAGMER